MSKLKPILLNFIGLVIILLSKLYNYSNIYKIRSFNIHIIIALIIFLASICFYIKKFHIQYCKFMNRIATMNILFLIVGVFIGLKTSDTEYLKTYINITTNFIQIITMFLLYKVFKSMKK